MACESRLSMQKSRSAIALVALLFAILPIPASRHQFPAAFAGQGDSIQAILQASTERLVRQGVDLLRIDDLPAAIAVYTELIRRQPDNADAWYGRGYAKSLDAKYDDALVDLAEAIRLQPNHSKAVLARGVCLESKHRSNEASATYQCAIALCDKLLTREPRNIDAYMTRAFANEYQYGLRETADIENTTRARDDFTTVIRIEPKNAVAYYERGVLYSNYYFAFSPNWIERDPQGHPRAGMAALEASANDWETAIRLDPTYRHPYLALANLHRKQGRHDAAISLYTKRISLSPPDYYLFWERGNSYRIDKVDLDRAIGDYGEAIRLRPDFADAYWGRGLALTAKGEVARGRADLAHARSLGYRGLCVEQ